MKTDHTQRIENIKILLTTYRDAVEALQSGNGGKATDELVLRWHELYMPAAYHQGAYGELENVLRRLRDHAPSLYFHVSHRYLLSERRVRLLRKDGFGKWRDVDTSRCRVIGAVMDKRGTHANRHLALIEEWDPRVDLAIVDKALFLMERIWPGEPRLPKDYLEPTVTQTVADAA